MNLLVSAFAGLPQISLSELDAQWQGNARHDFKFLMTQDQILGLIRSIESDIRVLQIQGQTSFRYHTESLDTPERLMYRQHVQGKAHRFKIRERTYLDAGHTQLELKERLGTSQTRKTIDPGADLLRKFEPLTLSATTSFNRMTLFRHSCMEKLTLDFDLALAVGNRTIMSRPDIVLVEVKSLSSRSQTTQELRASGIRPTSFSKYGSAVDLLVSPRPRIHSSKTLRKIFDLAEPEIL